MRRIIIYALLQVPGFLFVGILLLLAWENGWVSTRTALLIMGIWVGKDAVLYGFYKQALTPGSQDVIARLHGSVAVVKNPLEPEGHVALRGELWKAVLDDGNRAVPGERVKVAGNKGLTLKVRKLDRNDQRL
ncbi:MAG: NfeD family protein [Desulfonatronovibrionaceae bacterium]